VSRADLGEFVAARLCHDLISPVGAIGNGLELLALGSGPDTAEQTLISDSAANALGKLRFLRVAFGPADPEARQTFDEAAQITDAIYRGRFAVAWAAEARDMARPTAKLVYLAILCVERSLPMGGLLRITVRPDETLMSVSGRRTAPAPELWAHVTDGAPLAEVRSDIIQFPMLRSCLERCGGRLAVRFTDTGAELRLTAPAPMPA
jgi:histidine phosphotransferase ChpT